jgi:hypothetical protein
VLNTHDFDLLILVLANGSSLPICVLKLWCALLAPASGQTAFARFALFLYGITAQYRLRRFAALSRRECVAQS